jgi:Na+/melibiose symporter-like transporter
MSSDDVVSDREALRETARRRTRRGWWVVGGVLAFALASFIVGLLASTGASLGAATVIIMAAVLVGIVAALGVGWWLRRRDGEPPLASGANRGDRRAIQDALRTGQPRDARIDALTRQTADRNVRNSWLMVLYAVLLVFQIPVLIIRLTGDDDVWGIVLSVATIVLWAAGLAYLWVTRRRSRSYLRERPPAVD